VTNVDHNDLARGCGFAEATGGRGDWWVSYGSGLRKYNCRGLNDWGRVIRIAGSNEQQ